MKYSEELEQYKTIHGNYFINKKTYYLKICPTCKEKCLVKKNGIFCNKSCAHVDENNPNYRRQLTEEHKQKISKFRKGKPLSEEHKQKISEANKNKKRSEEFKIKTSKRQIGEKNLNWKGGVRKLNIPLFDTYAPQLEKYEEIRKTTNGHLEVKCTYCGKWFVPKLENVRSRIKSINGKSTGEQRFYCSNPCKQNCPLYRKKAETLMKKDAIRAGLISPDMDLTREVQPELRKLVFERDNWTCIKCRATKNLHCHHIEGILYNPIESADIDLCVTFCETCHKDAHKDIGCRYNDLQCKRI